MLGGLGGQLPFELGGGPSPPEKAFSALKEAVGIGGSSRNDDTIEAAWRMAKASGLASIGSFDEAAVMQGFPATVTDLLELYEDEYLIAPAPGETEQDRRERIQRRETALETADGQTLLGKLAAIDGRLGHVPLPEQHTTITQDGRAFQPWSGEPFNVGAEGLTETQFPNFSDRFVYHVVFDIGSGVAPSPTMQLQMEEARGELNRVLPAWVDIRIFTEVGFVLDHSLLDLAAFGLP